MLPLGAIVFIALALAPGVSPWAAPAFAASWAALWVTWTALKVWSAKRLERK